MLYRDRGEGALKSREIALAAAELLWQTTIED
jgi:hypothetical protein